MHRVGVGGQGLEELEQRRPVVPRGVGGAVHDVVPDEGGDRHGVRVGDAELGRDRPHVGGQGAEDLFAVGDEVDLVHGDDDVRHPHEGRDGEVATGLLEHSLAGVDEQHEGVGRRGPGDGVARVLHVAGTVGQDERALGGREVAVRDVDGDALLAFGP